MAHPRDPSDRTGASHLDDLALSRHLDGDADHAAHLAACERCGTRLDALRAVSAAMAAPPPGPDQAATDALIGTALAAWEPSDALDDVEGDGPRTSDEAVVVLAERRHRTVRWLAAAAMVLIALAAVPLLAGQGRSNDAALQESEPPAATRRHESQLEATAGGADESAADAAGDSAFADQAPDGLPAGPVSDGDIGHHREIASVARIVEARLEGPSAGPESAAAVAPQCEAEARGADPDAGALAYVATLTWDGTDAEALAFRSADGTSGYRLAIMDRASCAVLARGRT